MRHLRVVAGKYRALILAYLLMGWAGTFLQSFGADYFQTVVDNFTGRSLTAGHIAVYGSAMIMQFIVFYLLNYPVHKLENGFRLSLKTAALRKVATIDYLAYVRLGTGALIQRIENGAAAGGNMLFGFYLRLAGDLLPAMLFSIIFIFMISRTVTLAIMLGYIVVFIITNLLLKALYNVKERILVNEEMFNHFLVRGFMEMVVFRVNRRFRQEIRKAEEAAGEIVSSKVKMIMIHEAFFTIFAILIGFAKIGIIAYGWMTDALTIGQIVALIVLVDNAYTPLAIFNVVYVQFKLDRVAFARYTEFLDAEDDRRLGEGEVISRLDGQISFIDACFRYHGREIFRGLNLTIAQGKTTALVGESGSGKSTAVKLMAGLLHPDSGLIMADGYDLGKINLDSYYRHIAYLPQEPPVFDGTLRENLVFDERAEDAELLNAIRQVGLDQLYSKLEKGLDTQLGERGVNVSGGERQQLALARLWFSGAKVVIFDEATSAIDNLTEEAVMKNVMALLAGKTVIAIAHRLDSIKAFDRIMVFHDGCIVEQGGFAELMDKRKWFYELYNRSLEWGGDSPMAST